MSTSERPVSSTPLDERPTAEARRGLIVDLLFSEGRVEVGELASGLRVSEETIRRDLGALERTGVLARTHGGAVRSAVRSDGLGDPGWSDGMSSGSPVPRTPLFAERVAELIPEEAGVYIGAGPLCEAAAAILSERPGIRIVTSAVQTALAATHGEVEAELLFLGGLVRTDGVGDGQWAREHLASLNLDVALIELAGVTPAGGLLTVDTERAALSAGAMAVAASVVVLAAEDALRPAGLVRFGDVAAIDHLVVAAEGSMAVPSGAFVGEEVRAASIRMFLEAGIAVHEVPMGGADQSDARPSEFQPSGTQTNRTQSNETQRSEGTR